MADDDALLPTDDDDDVQLLEFVNNVYDTVLQKQETEKAVALEEALEEAHALLQSSSSSSCSALEPQRQQARKNCYSCRYFSRRLETGGEHATNGLTRMSNLLIACPQQRQRQQASSINGSSSGVDKQHVAKDSAAPPAAAGDEHGNDDDDDDDAQTVMLAYNDTSGQDNGHNDEAAVVAWVPAPTLNVATEPDEDGVGGGGGRRRRLTTNLDATRLLSVRFRLARGQHWTTSRPLVALEDGGGGGAHDDEAASRPTGTTPAFLKTSFATDDEQDLSFVPYFGDDDDSFEDHSVIASLYNTEGRERMVEFGPEYKEQETNKIVVDTLELAYEKLIGGGQVNANNNADLKKRIKGALATLMGINLDRIHQGDNHQPCSTDVESSTSTAAAASSSSHAKSDASPEEDYLETIDSYRQCFCRRCYTYDCNIHGCLNKPNIQLQGELAVQKERSGFWKRVMDDAAEETATSKAKSIHEATTGTGKVSKKRSLQEAIEDLDVRHKGMTELSTMQKSICERTFLMHQGDFDKIAVTLGAPRQVVADYATSQGMRLAEHFQHVRPDIQGDSKKRKLSKKSMKSYKASWLKRVEDAEIHPFFHPCYHSEPCSEGNCSCIKNRFFCTKHCVWGEKGRNFFKGCACKGGKCRTKSCACFAANRECDPDLCTACGACTDPPNQKATKQRCRNDNIAMRRHSHLLLGKSTIKEAGWGLFTKHALMKNDYIHEYVGEVISQDEAERRGMIYDKMNRSYLFNLSSDLVVDASRKANKTRFVNHSDRPNVEIRMTWVNGDIHIGFFALCDIEPQTELFFDYMYDITMENELIVKPGITVDWMKDPNMANRVSRKSDAG